MPSRSLLAAIVGIAIVPLAALLWVGWRLLNQEKVLAAHEAQQRVEHSADLVTAALQHAIELSERNLASDAVEWPEGAIAVTFYSDRVMTIPKNSLAYVPVARPLPEAPDSAFAAGDRAEYQQHDPAAAVLEFREVARSAQDPAVRAAAIFRLARNLSAAGEPAQALAEYRQLARADDVSVGGVPASLAAAYARCALLADSGRTSELLREAKLLQADLGRARWTLTQPVYELYAADAARWAQDASASPPQSELFAQAAAQLWDLQSSFGASGRRTLQVTGLPFVVLAQKSAAAFRALIAMPNFVEAQWLAAARPVAQQQKVQLFLESPAPPGWQAAIRTSHESDLPWNIAVASIGPPEPLNGFAVRRRLLISGFVLLALLASAAGYLVVRAVRRETAVARLQSDFVAAVSHEFRTPLTTLAQFTERLREHPELSADARRVCYDAQQRAASRLTRLVESLLDFGRIESGRRIYDFEPSDCGDLVERVIGDFRSEAVSAGHRIEFHRNGRIAVNADREALSRAIWNLLENAVKYSPQRPEVEVGLACAGGKVRIAVTDHGIGIPAGERADVFNRFQRGEEARRRGIPGTGIGLAMVAEIAKAHGGRVEVESQAGAGSTFSIVLPEKQAHGADSDRGGAHGANSDREGGAWRGF